MRIVFYGNGGSGNHGCEAIVRGTMALLDGVAETAVIHSASVEEDGAYGLDELAAVIPAAHEKRQGLAFAKAYIKLKLMGDYADMDGLAYLQTIRDSSGKAEIALSVGGDNYCYDGTAFYAYLNRAYRRAGMKTVLWGCSIEPNVARQARVAADLRRYDLIAARESITYEACRAVHANAVQMPDPAFFMRPKPCGLDGRWEDGEVIGVNVSPHILKCAVDGRTVYENYSSLVSCLLSNTRDYVALIPHVVWAGNDDRPLLRRLYQDFGEDPRLILVEDHGAPELKYIISRCCFFVGARTHATIAAYSSGVPTLTVGYSVKANGIARDLFGTEEGYVLPVQELTQPEQLTRGFCHLWEKKDRIQKYLACKIPAYCNAHAAVEALRGL